MAQYIEIEDGKIKGHYSAVKIPEGDQYKEVTDFQGFVGLRADALNDDGTMKSTDDLVNLGIIKDNRGDYYNKETGHKITIKNVNMEIPDGYTPAVPSNLIYEEYDEKTDSWIENADKKKFYEDSIKVSEAQSYLNSTDYKVIKAMESGVSLDELYPGETEARETAREIIRTLSEVSE